MSNLLLQPVDYKIEETRRGTWRKYLYPTGALYAEFISHGTWLGFPLIHFTRGICPETGKRKVARGVIAIGRVAIGGLAIGQVAIGVIPVGQVAVGAVAIGQAAAGLAALGQLAIGPLAAVGQIAAGRVAIGQIAVGEWVLAQIGFGDHVWSTRVHDPDAVDFFRQLWDDLRSFFE